MSRAWTESQTSAMTLRGKTLLVSAAAGSGKTSVLTERIIRLLTDRESPADISRLLIVTFTRAAAAELKGRIAAALSDALAEDPSNKHLSRQLLMLGGAQISTIDSFFQKIVRSNFEQLGLPATFRIADESEILPIAAEVLEGLIEEFYTRYEPKETPDTLSRVTENRFAEVMDHLLSNRSDGKLTGFLLDFFGVFSSSPDGIAELKRCADEMRADARIDFLQTRYGKQMAKSIKERFGAYLAELHHAEDAIASDPDEAVKCESILSSDILYCEAMLAASEERYDHLCAVASSFLPSRFPTIRNKSNAVASYQSFRALLRKEIAKVQEKLSYPSDAVAYQLQQTADLCEMLYRFYAEYETRLMAEKNRRGILEYNDIRAMLYRLLSTADGRASEFAKSLASQYDAVYIDEYQDVDLLQDRIFAMIGENRRFMVGDIKQSIYGFRGSDPSIFASYRRAMPLHTEPEAEDAEGICVFMSENFRCDRPVIDFANRVCAFLFSACEESVGYRPQDDLVCSKKPPEGAPCAFAPVQVAVFENLSKKETEEADEDGTNAEALWTAAEISRLLREEHLDDGRAIQPSDIAILVRTKAHGAAFAEELKRLGIPVAADAANDFLHEPLTTDLLNLLRVIDNPYRDLPLSELLLSPFGGFSLEEICTIREGAPQEKALFDAFSVYALTQDALGEKCAAMLAWMEAMRERAITLPADRFLRLLYLEERVLPFSDDPILLFLYEQARVYQRSSWCGLYGFLNHMEKLLDGKNISANGFAKAESAVTIMTVHHSKGLEFPVVFLSSCGSAFNRSDMHDNLLYHRNVGCASKLYDRDTGESKTTILREIVKDEIDAEQTEESIRTLYVALTRARERLYVTGTIRGKWDNALANAALVHRGNRSAILSCGSYLAWILAVMQEAKAENSEFPCIFQHIYTEEVEKGVSIDRTLKGEATAEVSASPSDPLTVHYVEISRKQATFDYPLSVLQGLPTKAAASKLRPDLVDVLRSEEKEDEGLEMQIELMRAATPTFDHLLSNKKKASAAEIGTATHAFLEFCDFKKLLQNGIDEESARLLEMKFLNRETVEIIHREQLEGFLKSDLMQLIKEAAQISREQKFSIFVPFSDLTADRELADALAGQRLVVQGSIDLLLTMEDGSLVLIDYKTDRIREEEQKNRALLAANMREKHGTQLACYREAVKQLFGKYPDKTYLYSLPLGELIEM